MGINVTHLYGDEDGETHLADIELLLDDPPAAPGGAVERYVTQWICAITDLTPFVREVHALVAAGQWAAAEAALPRELAYVPNTENGPKNTAPAAIFAGSSAGEGKPAA